MRACGFVYGEWRAVESRLYEKVLTRICLVRWIKTSLARGIGGGVKGTQVVSITAWHKGEPYFMCQVLGLYDFSYFTGPPPYTPTWRTSACTAKYARASTTTDMRDSPRKFLLLLLLLLPLPPINP